MIVGLQTGEQHKQPEVIVVVLLQYLGYYGNVEANRGCGNGSCDSGVALAAKRTDEQSGIKRCEHSIDDTNGNMQLFR